MTYEFTKRAHPLLVAVGDELRLGKVRLRVCELRPKLFLACPLNGPRKDRTDGHPVFYPERS